MTVNEQQNFLRSQFEQDVFIIESPKLDESSLRTSVQEVICTVSITGFIIFRGHI